MSVMPSAKGLWKMIVTFRERGSHDTADNLEAAAEKQAEVHLRTQELMNRKTGRNIPPSIQIPRNPIPLRTIKSRSPTPVLTVVEVEKSHRDSHYSVTSESELDSEEAQEKENSSEGAKRNRKLRQRFPSGRK